MAKFLTSIFGSRNDRLLKQYRKTVARINALEPEFEKLSDEALRGKTQEFKDRLAQGQTLDDLLPEAVKIVLNDGQASISMIQRKLRVGYARAARLIDIMETQKIMSASEGSKPRRVLIGRGDYERMFGANAGAGGAAYDDEN